MKVEIVTLQRITNFGSLLQTYATQEAIHKLGYKTEVIDFVPEGITFKRALFPKGQSKLLKIIIKFIPLLVVNLYQFYMVDKFLKDHVVLTPKKFSSYDQLSNDCPDADIYLSGSDQIWNTQNNNPEKDIMAYYLCFVPNEKKRVAYASSFGKTSFEVGEKQNIKKWLHKYDMISVREEIALDILCSLGIDTGVYVADPTLLLSREEWRRLANKKLPEIGYVFVYNLNRNKVVETLACLIAKERGLRVVNFADTFEFIKSPENRMFNTPIDFINYIANAEFVITDSYHGTVFSLKFGRQFLTVPAPKYNCRLESILEKTELLNTRYIKTIEEGIRALETEIDYSIVDPILERFISYSFEFLQNALGG